LGALPFGLGNDLYIGFQRIFRVEEDQVAGIVFGKEAAENVDEVVSGLFEGG
jgi:hypothetical protein